MTGEVTLPEEAFAPVILAAVGALPSHQTLKIDLTMELPYGQVGDKVINRLSCGDLETGTTVEVTGEPPYTGLHLPGGAKMLISALLLALPLVGTETIRRRKRGSR